MGQKPPKVIYGRQVPEAVSRNSFRDMVRQKAFKFGVVVAGALSLASSQPEPEPVKPAPGPPPARAPPTGPPA